MGITVRFEGISEAIGTLPKIPKNIEARVINEMSQIVFDQSLAGIDRHSKTGFLRKSLYNKPIANGREVGHDESIAPYAIYVHQGTKPHEIRPKDKTALSWVVGNKRIFAKFVKHPGYRGDGYMFAALSDALRQFNRIVDDALAKEA